jgi:CSLREA domain-containing protein
MPAQTSWGLAPRLTIATLGVALCFAGGGSPPTAFGASFTVNSTLDTVDANPGDGSCADATGACTLRAAVMETNGLPGADAITVPAGTYVLTMVLDREIGGGLFIIDNLTLNGSGARDTIIDTGLPESQILLDRIISIPCWDKILNVEIVGVTIQNGLAEGGGGISSCAHNLTLRGVTLTKNGGASLGGGGVQNRWGGSGFGTLTIQDSAIIDNWAARGGGVENAGPMTITNTTISGNWGGAIYSGGQASALVNVDIADNTAGPSQGVAISVAIPGAITAQNSILSTGPDLSICDNTVTSLGHNISSDASCALSAPGDLQGVDPMLGPLADNGGPTQTHALLVGSPAIDAGDPNGCPGTDQRGVARPQGAGCDIGAYEYQPPPPPPPPPAPIAAITAAPTTEPSPSVIATPRRTPTRTPKKTPKTSPTLTPLADVEETDDSGSPALMIGGGIAELIAVGGAGAGGWWAYRKYGPRFLARRPEDLP